jgi:hypothetical protein
MAYSDAATTAMRVGITLKSIKINNLLTPQSRPDLAGGARGSKIINRQKLSIESI